MAILLEPQLFTLNSFSDDRGKFRRLFCKRVFEEHGITFDMAQINHSFNNFKGTFRGLHYQNNPYNEAKFIACLNGQLLDILVDIRYDSDDFLRVYYFNIDSNDNKILFIPNGFAHGFQTLTDNCIIFYMHDEFYTPSHDAGLNIADPKLKIKLPERISVISDRDTNHPFIKDSFKGLKYEM